MTSSADLTFVPEPLDRSAPFYVAGHRGLVGSAMWHHLHDEGFTNLQGKPSSELDLLDRDATFAYLEEIQPRNMVIAAAKVGGILANSTAPADFISKNLRIQTNLLDAAVNVGVQRLLFLGSSCIYPKFATQPISESALLTGALEPTNDAYAIAKIAGIIQVQAVRRQYGLPWICAMPTNLYGERDNFTPGKSHVLPALISRYVEAKSTNAPSVTNWGTGTPRRELLHSKDAAAACLHLMENYDSDIHVNVGTGTDVPIKDLAAVVAEAVGYTGITEWDHDKPDGTPQKLLDVSLLTSLGWQPSIPLNTGIQDVVTWYIAQHPSTIRHQS